MILKGIIASIESGKTLKQAYQFEYLEEENNSAMKATNRKHILDYIKMLAKFTAK